MTATTGRIDVHQHIIPDFYRDQLRQSGLSGAGGRELPPWSPDTALEHMSALGIGTGILSVSTPGTAFVGDPGAARVLAAKLNDHSAEVAGDRPERFGWFGTVPLPDVEASATAAEAALDNGADGITLLANNRGTYLGESGQDRVFEVLDERSAVAFIHPASLPAPPVEGIPPFAADFLLDTTRAAYLLVRNRFVERYPNIRFILSHAGGFVPYASHRMATAIAFEGDRGMEEVVEDFRSFYFDTALSSSPAALPTLLAFARPDHILFGSDWPFAPTEVGGYFAHGLDGGEVPDDARAAIDSANALALFPRLAGSIAN